MKREKKKEKIKLAKSYNIQAKPFPSDGSFMENFLRQQLYACFLNIRYLFLFFISLNVEFLFLTRAEKKSRHKHNQAVSRTRATAMTNQPHLKQRLPARTSRRIRTRTVQSRQARSQRFKADRCRA
jgi:predicted membrane metal-binding protein